MVTAGPRAEAASSHQAARAPVGPAAGMAAPAGGRAAVEATVACSAVGAPAGTAMAAAHAAALQAELAAAGSTHQVAREPGAAAREEAETVA